MKRSSWFSTVFLPICLSAGLTIAASAARVKAQTQPFDDLKEKFLKEVEGAKRKIAKNPNDAHEHYRLGGFYVKLYQFQDAVAAYSQALKLKPDFAYAHYDLGWCYTRMYNYEEALKAHREAEKHIQITSFKLRLTEEEVNYASSRRSKSTECQGGFRVPANHSLQGKGPIHFNGARSHD